MADVAPFFPDQELELDEIHKEAPYRWFRPPEICEILSNHSKYSVCQEPPFKPSAGSVFLFNRKVLRYFRKDGHNWRKKKDGKTVREAHEKLKVGGVDALHCYYAHGEDNEKFQRRIYWMLNTQLEHIVLVHYREVDEGHKTGQSHFLKSMDSRSHLRSPETTSMSWSGQPVSPVQVSDASNISSVDWNECRSHSQLGDRDSATVDTLLHVDKGAGFSDFPEHNLVSGLNDGSYIPVTSSFWTDVESSSKNFDIMPNQMLHFDQIVGTSNNAPESSAELNKLDSFGRWMDREIGQDCDDSLMAADSKNYWNGLDTANDIEEVSRLSRHVKLDTYSLGPSLSQEQLFSISDMAPCWAYSGAETKVLIVLGDKKASEVRKWRCMFGEIEVSCDVLSENMIRCQVPCHPAGRVPFYVTCGNRLACSEVWEFRFLSPLAISSTPEEVSLQIRLAKLLCFGLDGKWLDCKLVDCDKCEMKTKISTLIGGFEKSSCGNFKDTVIEDLLKEKLYEWLVCKAHESDNGPLELDDEGQGVIHLAASLGYVWALGPIIASGVSPNVRDKQGRTSLHWASYFGREEAVITLVKLGASAAAVDDPTPEFPGGRKPADLALDRGCKGIAEFLKDTHL